MSEAIPPSRVRAVYAVGCLFLLGTSALFAGAFAVWAARPLMTEEQLQEAAARVARAREESVASCPRPVLRGVALPGDGAEGLRGLADWREPSARCFEQVGRDGLSTREVFLSQHIARLATAEALPIEQSVEGACAGLDARVQAELQRESGCTAQSLFLAEAVVDAGHLKLMMFILARAHIHAGRLQEGMEQLLDVIRLGQDLTRGDASLVPVRVGLQLQQEAAAQLEALLASDLPWTPTMLDELARQARVLATTMPEPTQWFEHEEIRVRLHALDQRRGPYADNPYVAERDLVAADYGEARWPDCTAVALAVCVRLHREAIVDAEQSLDRLDRVRSIPGVTRELNVQLAYLDRLRERESVLIDAAHNEALLRVLPALFLHRRMSLSGTCPTDDGLEVVARAAGVDVAVQRSLEPLRPLHLRMPGVAPPLYRAHCPALREADHARVVP